MTKKQKRNNYRFTAVKCIHPFHNKTHHAPPYFPVFLPVVANLPLFRTSPQTKNPIMAGPWTGPRTPTN